MVSIFSELTKNQTYKMPNKDSPNREIEILISFKYLNVFKPNEHTEDYHIRKLNDENFYSKWEIENMFTSRKGN